jgi:glycerol-3-phosphate acyltransferase PlsY
VSYFVGALPTGYWFAKYIFNIDITKSGSGNIGATNVGRILGKKYFALIFLIDFLKAFLTLYVVSYIFSNSGLDAQRLLILSAMALLFGNAYSIFLKFNGGKGVATTVGILASLFPAKLLLLFMCAWLLILYVIRKPFIASLMAVYLSCPVYYFCFSRNNNQYGHNYFFYLLIFICFWLTLRHTPNIRRIFIR